MFGQRLSFGVNLFYDDLFYLSPNNLYDQLQYGVTFSLRKPLGEHSYVELGYTLEEVKIQNVVATASPQIQAEAGSGLESKVDLSWVHDSRDSVFITRTGHKIDVGATLIGNFLGGDVDVYGLHAEASQYFSLPFDMILSFDGALRTVSNWGGGTQVPIYERLFLGGANDLRGFNYREVGPKDATGEPLGGLTSLFGTAELTIPVFEKVRLAIFYDVGMVGADRYSFSGEVNSDIGIGVRLYFLPTGPIRLDFGVPIQDDPQNKSNGRFNFNIGYRF
jgi:outer membrane protein insertion porin family